MEEKRKDYPDILLGLRMIEATCNENTKDILEIKHIVKGGDTANGLIHVVNNHTEYIKELRDFHGQIRDTMIKCTGTIIASVFIAMIIYVMRIR